MSLLSKTSLSLVWTVPSTLCLCSRGRGAGRRGASCFNAESVPSLGQLGRQRRTQLLCSKSQRCYALMAHLGLQHSIRNCAKGVGASDHKRLSCDHNAVTLLEAFSGHLLRLPKLPAEHKSQPTDPKCSLQRTSAKSSTLIDVFSTIATTQFPPCSGRSS